MGNDPSEMMDRERAFIPKLQIQFLDDIALPVYRCVARSSPARFLCSSPPRFPESKLRVGNYPSALSVSLCMVSCQRISVVTLFFNWGYWVVGMVWDLL